MKLKWHSGQPPHVGWWMASIFRDEHCWRWFDGKHWALPASDDESAVVAAMYANRRAAPHHAKQVEWTDYYPENARVPRIDPRSKK